VKYLTIKDQMEKCRETKYYITVDIETLEELVSTNLNGKNKDNNNQTRRGNIKLLNQSNKEKQVIIAFRNKYVKHMVVYLEKCSDIVYSYLRES
jgi:hypothetical protein